MQTAVFRWDVASFFLDFNASMSARYPTDVHTLEALNVVAFIAVRAMATLKKSTREGAALNHKPKKKKPALNNLRQRRKEEDTLSLRRHDMDP